MDETTKSVLHDAKRVAKFHQQNKEAMEDVDRRFHCTFLFEEFKILDRLLYKYHNQQRRHVHYRRLRLLRRRLQRVHTLLVYTHWSAILKNASITGTVVLRVLYEHVQRAVQDCLDGYEAVYAVLQDMLYVPFAMMCVGCVARIYAQLKRLALLVNAMRLDVHAGAFDRDRVEMAEFKVESGVDSKVDSKVDIMVDRKVDIMVEKRERLESGWESATTEQKQRQKRLRYVKKIKRTDRCDEIDDIFKD